MQPARRTGLPRLYHTKSKTGCIRCRARRVKCNESRPVCNNCHRHDVACEYDRNPQTQTQAQPSPPAIPVPVPAGLLSPPLDQADYWQLRALHHFTAVTSATLPGTHIPSVRECWSVQVPIIALQHKPLWNEILALAALHLLVLGCQDVQLQLLRAAWLEAALQEYRAALGDMSPATADAASFTSMLILFDASAALQHRPLLDDYHPPVQWLRIVEGVKAVAQVSLAVLNNDPTSKIMVLINTFVEGPGLPQYMPDGDPQPFAHLARPLAGGQEQLSPEAVAAYELTARMLSRILMAAEAHEEPMAVARRIMSFASLAPSLFLDLVEQSEPRALVLMGHYFALMMHIKHMWWVGNTPTREVKAICRHLPPEFQSLMEWPRRLVGDARDCDSA